MSKIIDGKEYFIPINLTAEQEKIYCHIINWKQSNITAERVVYKGREYDAILPMESHIPAMIYRPIVPILEQMQQGTFAYKPHKFAHHAVSSQTACINLFMPLLLSNNIDTILPTIPGAPNDFMIIARDRLFNGFCFEYWGQDVVDGGGLLHDHSAQAGTDADVAIAYYNTSGKLCLWLIEHKLSEKEFTECGAYNSPNNDTKSNCKECNLKDIAQQPERCYYHAVKGYRYWELLHTRLKQYLGEVELVGCPFRHGMNQLWRNQVLAFALEDTGVYHRVTFSVCHHAKNTMLNNSINQYKTLTNYNKMFSSFTNYDIINAIDEQHCDLHAWRQWYREVYCF